MELTECHVIAATPEFPSSGKELINIRVEGNGFYFPSNFAGQDVKSLKRAFDEGFGRRDSFTETMTVEQNMVTTPMDLQWVLGSLLAKCSPYLVSSAVIAIFWHGRQIAPNEPIIFDNEDAPLEVNIRAFVQFGIKPAPGMRWTLMAVEDTLTQKKVQTRREGLNREVERCACILTDLEFIFQERQNPALYYKLGADQTPGSSSVAKKTSARSRPAELRSPSQYPTVIPGRPEGPSTDPLPIWWDDIDFGFRREDSPPGGLVD
jgi:hypothetical protein